MKMISSLGPHGIVNADIMILVKEKYENKDGSALLFDYSSQTM